MPDDLEAQIGAYEIYLNHVAWCIAELAPELLDALDSRGKEWLVLGEEMAAEAGPESWPSPLIPHMTEIHALFINPRGGWEPPTFTKES